MKYRLGDKPRNAGQWLIAFFKTVDAHDRDCHCYCWTMLPCTFGWHNLREYVARQLTPVVCKIRGRHRYARFVDLTLCVTCGCSA